MPSPVRGGFDADLFRFLDELRASNNRGWFNARKERCEAVEVSF